MYGQSSTATQTLQLSVLPVASLAVSGEPSLLAQATAAGEAILQTEDRTSRYRLSSNRPALKLSASMNEALPEGMRLLMKAASLRGSSIGPVEISGPMPVTLVSGIAKGVEVDQEISYTLLVNTSIVSPTSAQRTVIITLSD